MKKTLNGKWKFRCADGGQWKEAQVPGCNFLDLMRNGDIPDPFYGVNEKKVQWVGEKDWEYKRSFFISADELLCDDIILNCKMLDTVCSVYINGVLLFRADNCFRPYSRSVRELVREGENEIKAVFCSPVKYVEEKYARCPTPVNSNGLNGIVHIRKPQCHFGWDWGPVLPCSGISADIELELVQGGRIKYLSVGQELDGGRAVITVKTQAEEYSACEYCVTLTHPDGKTEEKDGCAVSFTVENPELWQTAELSGRSRQPLYTVTARLIHNGETVDSQCKRTGIRTVELNRERDSFGKNFQFRLNGVPLFIKGANLIPPDCFITRFDGKRLNALLDAVQFSNMNMIRVWGGGYYADDALLDACDERGILVWQDFQFACQAYPFFDSEFLQNVKDEVEYNVKRLCSHPCLAVWNGNNEIEDMHSAWAHMTQYVKWTERFFYSILENEIRKYDKKTPYTPGSPCGISHNRGVDADNVGDTHLWGVWHGLRPMTYYRRRMTRFCSEFGFESLPDIKTVRQFAPGGELSLDGEVFKAHQKCACGNDKMVYYIASRYSLPRRFEDYIYLSQITQLECIADATEHWRRNKGRCNGAMYWQLNDCWGVCSWSGMDYCGSYKALQYGARRFNAPVSVSAEDDEKQIKIYALNDLNSAQELEAVYEIFDFESGVLESGKRAFRLNPLENRRIFELDVRKIREKYDIKRTGVCIRLYKNSAELMQKTVLFDREKNLDLPKARLKAVITVTDNGLRINIKTDKFARYVSVHSSRSSAPFSDNFFDLLPGQSKEITIAADGGMTPGELAQSISLQSLCNVRPEKKSLKTAFRRYKVFLSPVSIANAVYHGRVPKDCNIPQ